MKRTEYNLKEKTKGFEKDKVLKDKSMGFEKDRV